MHPHVFRLLLREVPTTGERTELAVPISEEPSDLQLRYAKFTSADYIGAFGDTGARWFLEGKSFAVAAAEHIAALNAGHKTEVDALKAENTALKTKLDAMPRGNDAASFSVESGSKAGAPTQGKFSNLSPNLAKFAESLVIPNGK